MRSRADRARSTRIERTAYHEAGHAVVAFFSRHLGKTKDVTIEPDAQAGTLGCHRRWPTPSLRPDADVTRRDRLRLEEGIVVFLAGPIAERQRAGRWDHVGADRDRRCAVDMASYLVSGDQKLNALLQRLDVRAERLVHRYWAEIEAVASALLKEPTLKRRRLQEVIQGVLAHDPRGGASRRSSKRA